MAVARLFVALSLLLWGAARGNEQNLVELHRSAASIPQKRCLTCHAEVMKGVSLDKKVKTFHRLHLESKKGTPTTCKECHPSVDLREGSAAAQRKQVDPELCAGCHRGDVAGAKVLFAK